MNDVNAPRLLPLHRETMSAEQQRVHDQITAGPRGSVPAPLAVWLRSPALAETAQQLGQFARYDSSLEPRLSELVILLVGRFWTAHYEWWVHRPIAEAAGLASQVIDAIRDGQEPTFLHGDEKAVYDFVQQLLKDHRTDDSVYRAALAKLGEVGVVDLVGICGYYSLISMTLNAFDVPLPEGEESEL